MRRGWFMVLLGLLAVAFWFSGTWGPSTGPAPAGQHPVAAEGALPQADAEPARPVTQRVAGSRRGALPPEAFQAIALIQQGGPFPHRQDGGVFGNREGRLPRQPRGWYREYTVETPAVVHRGARRIVTGGAPPTEWYYTDDHYDSFRRFHPAEETP